MDINENTPLKELKKMIDDYNSNYVFDENNDNILCHILSNSSEKDLDQYIELLEKEKNSHDAVFQHELARLLWEMAKKLRHKEYPHSPICQWFMEMYTSPALYWVIKAVEQDYVPAYNLEITIVEWGSRDVRRNIDLAKALLYRGAAEGDIELQMDLAYQYSQKCSLAFNGPPKYVEYNLEKAGKWYEKISEQQNPVSFESLAHYYGSIGDYEKCNFYYGKMMELSNDNRELRIDMICNYISMGDILSAIYNILIIVKKEDDDMLIKTYQLLHTSGWLKIDDVMVEKILLDKLVEHGNQKAKEWLHEKYKYSFFTKRFMRSRHWKKPLYSFNK